MITCHVENPGNSFRRPGAPSGRKNLPPIESLCRSVQAVAGIEELLDHRGDSGRIPPRLFLSRFDSLPADFVGDHRTSTATKFYSPGLGRSQGLLRAPADHLPFVLGDRGENVKGKLVGIGVITGNEVNPSIHQVGNKRQVAGEPVKFRNDKRRPGDFAPVHGGLQGRPVVLLAAFHLDELLEELAEVAPDVIPDRLALGMDPMALLPLLVG